MEQMNRSAIMCCLGCLSSGNEYKIQEFKMKYYPRIMAILEVKSLNLCYLCRTMAQRAEIFMWNVHHNQTMLEKCLKDCTTSVKPASERPPPMTLMFSGTHTDSVTAGSAQTDNTREGSFTSIATNTAGVIQTVLSFTLANIKKELSQKPANISAASADAATRLSQINVKQEVSFPEEPESNDDFDQDIPIKPEKLPLERLVQQENTKMTVKSSPNMKVAKKTAQTKTGKKRMTMKQILEAAKKKNDEASIEKVQITLEQCMEERRLKALEPAYQARPYKCDHCVKGFAQRPTYEEHLQRHSVASGSFVCSVCAVRHSTTRKLAIHTRQHTVRYRCRQCGLTYTDRASTVAHVLSRHRTDATHACPHCHKRFKRHSSYKKHVQYTHERKTERVVCDMCNNSFATKDVLRKHMVYQHPEAVGAPAVGRVHRCPQCPAAFKQASNLIAHALTHSEDRPHYCVECDKRYKTAGALTLHLKTAEPHIDKNSPSLPSCPQCNKRFTSERGRDRHMDSMHLNRRPHKCEICNKAYVLKWDLQRHVLTAHEGYKPPRNYLCHYCEQAFTTRQVLVTHIRRHTGERPFQCGECEATFAQNGALHTHRRLVHQRLPKKRDDKRGKDKKRN